MLEGSDQGIDRLKKQFSRVKSLCKARDADNQIIEELEILEEMVLGEEERDQKPLSAQLSIYPLRQPSLSVTINEALDVLKGFGLKTIPGSMSTLILGKSNDLWKALKKVFSIASEHGQVVMIITLSNACPKPKD
jgi:uncharacterized protein YqgV (UPF0045/DUF77 family)